MFLLGFIFPNYDINIWFALNKDNFNKIERILQINPEIKSMSNCARYYKNLNDEIAEGQFAIKTREDIEKYFSKEISEKNISIDAIYTVRNLLEKSDVISVQKYDDCIVFKIDGFLDTEYGIIKFADKVFREGDYIKSLGRVVRTLKELNNGYYYWST